MISVQGNKLGTVDTPSSLYREYTETQNTDCISHIRILSSTDKIDSQINSPREASVNLYM